MRKSKQDEAPGQGIQQLLSICQGGHRFYTQAADLSRNPVFKDTMRSLEADRAQLVAELQGWVEPAAWPESSLISLVRRARHDDRRILDLCEQMDLQTIAAYKQELGNGYRGRLKSLLESHLQRLLAGRAIRAALGVEPGSD